VVNVAEPKTAALSSSDDTVGVPALAEEALAHAAVQITTMAIERIFMGVSLKCV
jgi:hypothetical protein